MINAALRPPPRFGRVHVLATLLSLTFALLPATAAAQGRCSCNTGCHMFPGQCVLPGSSGCESGFAPFCATRASSCPRTGWVSCSGDCTCVRVTPVDAGFPDAGSTDASPPGDVILSMDANAQDVAASADVLMSLDVGAPSDGATPTDARSTLDAPTVTDARPTSDAPASADATTPSDTGAMPDAVSSTDASARDATALDVTAQGSDAAREDASTQDASPVPDDRTMNTSDRATPATDGGAPAADGGCDCVGGACVAGVCYRERCVYNAELGFTCTTRGTTCRLFGADPICVPLCAGVTCAAGEFCDKRSNGACVTDRCASIICPVGTTCVRNQCGRWTGPDGGVFVAKDPDAGPDDGGVSDPRATDVGCGCRVGGRTSRGRGWGLSAALLALLVLSGRRRPSVDADAGRATASG